MNRKVTAVSGRFVALVVCAWLAGCGQADQDFCQYLSLAEAQQFDPDISDANMRQTNGLLYCVWGDGKSDRLFISLDRAMDYKAVDFLSVVAKNSPEPDEELIRLFGIGTDAAALFLGENDEMQLDFLVVQNRDYSVTIRARDVTSSDSPEFEQLKEIAATVLSRL